MPTLQEIEQAMIAADRAGDKEAARILAGEIRRLMEGAQGPKRGIGAAFQRGLESQLSAGRTGLSVLTGTPEEAVAAAQAGVARGEEIGRKYEDQIGLERLKKVYEDQGLLAAGKEAVRQIPLAITEQLPQIGALSAGAAAGARLGRPLGVPGMVGGTLVGATIPSLFIEAGGQAERRVAEQAKRGETPDIDRGELLGTAGPSAALNVAGTLIPLGGQFVSKLTGIPVKAFFGRSAAQAEKLANERFLTTLAKGTVTGAAVEIPTEIMQQMLERVQAGLPLTGPEAFAEYGETAYRVGLLGPLGAAGRFGDKFAAQDEMAAAKAARAAEAQQAAAAEPPVPPTPPTPPTPPAEEIPLEERRFQDITPVPGAVEERRFRDITPVPTKLAPTEEAAPQRPINVVQMMDEYDVAAAQLEPLETAMQNAVDAGDLEAYKTLQSKYDEFASQLDQMRVTIEELGGTTKSPETFEKDAIATLAGLDKKITETQKKASDANQLGDRAAAVKLLEKLDTLKTEREEQAAQFERERRALTMKTTPKGETVDMLGEAAPKISEELNIPYDTLEFTGLGQPSRRSSGQSPIINLGNRMIVVRNVNGVQVPFYLSTGGGGKADVPAGKWYPFFGVGADGWINKTTGKEMVDYYGSPALKQAAEELDRTIGDIRNDNSVPRVARTGQHIDYLNRGFNPSENEQADTLDKVNQNIAKIKSLVDAEKGLTKEVGAGPLPPEDFRRRPKKQLELALEPPKPIARITAPWLSAKERREAMEATPENETYPLFRDIPQRKQPEAAAPVEEAPKKEPTGVQVDLFSDFNLFNTAVNNRDEKTIEAMQLARKKADTRVALSPREQVAQMLDQQVGGIVRREANYAVRTIERGPNAGEQVYVYDDVVRQLEAITKTVTTPQKNAKRSYLQMLHDEWDRLQAREAKLEAAKEKGDEKEIKKYEAQVAVAKRDYQEQLDRILKYRNAYEKVRRQLFTQKGELAPAPGEGATPTILTPRQKQEALMREGRSKREMSAQAKAAKRVNKGKVKVSKAKVAQELGRETKEYAKFVKPYNKQLADAVTAYEKFVDDANKELAKRRAKEVDAKEVAKVEKELAAAIAARDAVPFENPLERKKADKLVNSLEQHLKVVKTPKSEAYKAAEANIVKLHDQKVAELNRLRDELTATVNAKAEELGRQHPEFAEALAEATESYQEAVAGGEQEVKSLRTPQVTRKLPKMKTTRTASPESRAETARGQAAFEGTLSAEKGEAYDYQQREEARERTRKAREAKAGTGTAMQAAMTKAALAREKEISDVQAIAQYDTAATIKQLKEEGKFARGVEIESPDLTAEQIKMLEANDLRGTLRSIMNASDTTPISKAVMEAMLPMLDATNVKLFDRLYDPEGKEVLGEAVSKLVKLSRNGGLSQEVLLHEATHAAVERVIYMGEKDITLLTKEQQAAFKELRAIHAQIKKDPSITSTNAKGSLSEFAAELFSNRNLHEQLRKKPWRISNMLDAIRSVILRLLGVKQPQSMLGAGLKAVEALMMPSSMRPDIKERTVNKRQYSAKDIAALDTGSNSMKQFAEQFGTDIKQKDRTVADVDRIALSFLNAMGAFPDEFVAAPKVEKINVAAMTRMPDGRVYDPENPVDFYTADPQVILLGAMGKGALKNAAQQTYEDRQAALQQLADYLVLNSDYTLAEQALVAKAASKFGVTSDKNGRLKLVTLDDTNLHPVAVVGHVSARAVIEELRAGKNLKTAFIDGMQRVADDNAKQNAGKQGWKRFEQSSDYDAAVALNAGAAGTSWCTGSTVSTAQMQIQNGDFYIYYNKGKPEIAIRMNGSDSIAEIRGNTPNQALSAEQQKTATDFIRKRDFGGATDYLVGIELREKMASVFRGESTFTPEETQKFFMTSVSVDRQFRKMDNGYDYDESPMRRIIADLPVMGYGQTSSMSEKVAEASDRVLAKAFLDAYADNRFVGVTLPLDGRTKTLKALFRSPFDPQGSSFECRLEDIKAINGLAVGSVILTGAQRIPSASELSSLVRRDDKGEAVVDEFEFSSLEQVRAVVFNRQPSIISLPNVKTISHVTVANDFEVGPSLLYAPKGSTIGVITPDTQNGSLLLAGEPVVNKLVLTRGPYSVNIEAPDVTTIKDIIEHNIDGRVFNSVDQVLTLKAGPYADALSGQGLVFDGDTVKPVDLFTAKFYAANENEGARIYANKIGKALLGMMSDQQLKAFKEQVVTEYSGGTSLESFMELAINAHLTAPRAELNDRLNSLQKALEKLGVSEATFDSEIRPKRGTLTAPELKEKQEEILDAEFVEIPEQPRYAPKDVGPYEKAKGVFGFRSQVQPTPFASSFVAQEQSAVDNFRANALGLAGRVQFVDQYAALSDALRKGVDSKVVNELEAEQAEYYLRFGQQRSQLATQFLTSGPVKIVMQQTKRGKEFSYQSTPGANMAAVAEALEKSGISNGTQLEAMFTAYVAGMRAEQVGWEKLHIKDPALAKSEYKELMAMLDKDKRVADAFKEAAKLYKEYNAGLLDFLVQTGFMTKEKAAELKALDYIPYYRVKAGELQLMVDTERPVRLANIKDQPELHSLVGDNAQIMPIFTSAVQNTFILTNMGLRNQSVKDTSFLLKRMGIASKLGEGSGPSSPDTVRFKVNGEDYFAVIDENLYGIPAELIVRGMEGIKTAIPAAVRLMGIPADYLRTFVTRNPAYAIRQAFRDPMTAYMSTGMDGIPVLNSMKELAKMVAGRSEEERKLMAAGAISTNVLTGDEKDMQKALRAISTGKNGATKLLAKLDAFAMQGDAATRATIYRDSIAKGMSDMQAYLRTLESMNFSRRGLSPSMQWMSTLVPFFNAQIQGLDVLYRTFTGKYGGMPYNQQLEIKKKLMVRGTLMAMATLAYAMAMEDDEAYKRAKPEERLGNWFVRTPFADEPLKIPIPFEFGYIFKALPEAVYNLAAKDERNEDISKGMVRLVGLSNPFSLPQAIKPLVEVRLGRSFFGGDIESMREKNTLLPEERYRASTTELSKMLGSITGGMLTPIELDYLIRGYTGGLGMAILSAANPLLSTERDREVPEPTTKASKLPFVGGLFQPVEGRGTLDATYERMLEIQQATGTFKRLLESGKRAEAKEFLEEYKTHIAAISVSGALQQRLGELAKYRRLIIETPKLTTEQKDTLLERIDQQQYQLGKSFISLTEKTTRQ